MNNWLKINQRSNAANLTDWIFKEQCTLCQATPTVIYLALCQPCLTKLPFLKNQCCKQCSIPTQSKICGRCLKQRPHYDETHALFSYQFPLDQLLQHYKYNEALHLSQTFGRLLSSQFSLTNIDVIIPMPLHPNRLKARGFNQSLEIAKVIAKQTNIPLDVDGCLKIKDRPPQASLAYKERIKNIKKAFICNKPYNGLNVAIVDDVMTTGATLNELAKILKQAGAAKVDCYVLARAE